MSGLGLGLSLGRRNAGKLPWHAGWNFSRDSAALAWTYDGRLRSFSIGQKAITDLGLFISGASTQRVSNPTNPTGSEWTRMNVAAALSSDLSVDGVTPMYTLNEGTESGEHWVSYAATAKTAGTYYTLSVIVKKGTSRYVQLGFSSATHGTTAFANFDIEMAAGGSGNGAGITYNQIEPLGDGYFLLTIGALATVSGSGVGFFAMCDGPSATRNAAYTGTGRTIHFGGLCERAGEARLGAFQLQALSASLMTKTVSEITGSFTAYMECFIERIPNDGARLLSICDGSGTISNAVEIRTQAQGGLYPRIFNAGIGSDGTSEGSPIQLYPKSRRIALRYDAAAGQGTLFINGVKLASFSMALPTGLSTIKLGRDLIDASSCPMFVSDFDLERSAWSDVQAINRTSRPAIFPSKPSYSTSDVRFTTRRFQGLPSITLNASKTKLWGIWYGQRFLNHSSGEGTGTFCILSRSDDLGVTSSGDTAYLLPANKNVFLCSDPRIWRAPNGRVWVLYNQSGSAVLQDGQFGVWAVEILNPEAAAAPIFGRHYRLLDRGWCSRPFLADGKIYIPISQWVGPSGQAALKHGIEGGKFIYEWDLATMSLTYHSKLPAGTNPSFDETAVVDNGDGTWHSVWRTTSGLQQATWSGISWGSASSWTDITPTADSRAAYQRSPYSGRRVIVFNKSAPGARSDATIAVYHSGAWYQFTWDTRSNISYFDMDCDDSGNWYIWYDFERTTSVGSGARAVEAVVINEDAVVAGTAATTIRRMSAPVGP